MYHPHTDQIFGFDENLDSIQKWNKYELNMKALIKLKSMIYNARRTTGAVEQMPSHLKQGAQIVAGLKAALSNDLLLLNDCPYFQYFRRICVVFPLDYASTYTELGKLLNYALSSYEVHDFWRFETKDEYC